LLQQLAQQQIVRKAYGQIEILNMAALKTLSELNSDNVS